jgi:repressor LexA
MRPLTERQKLVLEFIRSSVKTRGFPPTLREIGVAMGIRSNNGVNDHIRALERKGYLVRDRLRSRGLRPVELGDDGAPTDTDDDGLVRVVVFRRLVPGVAWASQDVIDTVYLGREALSGGHRDIFGLVAHGDAMVDAGILDGDYVLARRQLSANRGEIVVALVGDEASIRVYRPEATHVRLEPANRQMAPVYIRSADFKPTMLLGVVVGLYRRIKTPSEAPPMLA